MVYIVRIFIFLNCFSYRDCRTPPAPPEEPDLRRGKNLGGKKFGNFNFSGTKIEKRRIV